MSDNDEMNRELPESRPLGMLGEHGLNVLKSDTFEPDGVSAGLLQESTWETRWLAIALAYLVFFPLAFVLVWRSKRLAPRTKVIATVVMLAGVVAVASQLLG